MRRITTLFMILLSMMALTASSIYAQDDETDTEAVQEITWECPAGFEGQTLNVYNWATYIGEETISTFEDLCNVEVTYDVYDTNESLIARMRLGNPGYDVAFPNDYAVSIMADDELIQSIDIEQIPNFENIAEQWQGLDFDPENAYSVPYLWGTMGIAYNVNEVEGPITSWEQVWNHDGPVAWLNDGRAMIPIALLMLGYNPNTDNPEEIQEASDYLLENSDNVIVLAADDGQALLERGEVDIAVEYNGDIYQIIVDCECDDYAYSIPEEGSIADITNMVLLTDAPNPELAVAFMDYILDPVVNGDIASFTGYATANAAAVEMGLVDEELLNNEAIFPNAEQLGNLFFLEDVGDAEVFYSDIWDELTILIGG